MAVCYNYACAANAMVVFSESQMQSVDALLGLARNAADERAALAQALGVMARFAGAQTPIHNDRGGNYADQGVQGSMDCIDHTANNENYLSIIEGRGDLKWHTNGGPVWRPYQLISRHWAMSVIERQSDARFVFDTWFLDHGESALVFTLADWLHGAGPDVH